MEIVEVVSDQVVVALSHATVLEELMREKLEARNGLLQQAKENVVKAVGQEDYYRHNGENEHRSVNLINDAMDIPDNDEGRFQVKMMSFQLHSLIREVSCLVKCLCVYKSFGFSMDVPTSLPNLVMGDEKRT
ncbi:protein EIN4-like [Solanum lycopersicum]|uniref:Uncharacterized protein n=1 Tax=Solanum lycopersicum TaxID=4081 RepID=K4BRX2_SOLLC